MEIPEQDIDNLCFIVQGTPPVQQRAEVENWQRKLVGHVASVAGQGTAGILANLLAPILAKFLGIS